ncbi:MAG: hypothetical protein Q9220_000571 [cf. Caloplaca sp. 1 TL-2023]
MSNFLTELFTSIFTPGPTHSLIIATNVSFAALQVVLLILLILTYSIHFIVLSILCAGLWWSINWFAAEVEAARKSEKEQAEQQSQGDSTGKDKRGHEDSDTETEGGDDRSHAVEEKSVSLTSKLPIEDAEASVRKRRSLGSSTGDLSTDSEWDKVEEADTQR